MKISIIIRTLNEAKHLNDLLDAVESQSIHLPVEVVVVDSGSTDGTLDIAVNHNSKIVHISQDEFSFGRSLNIGCEHASGDLLAFISGHCIPADNLWLSHLAQPLITGDIDYIYGRQLGRDTTRYSEERVFEKYYGDTDRLPQEGFHCNNANAMIRKDLWEKFRFNEELTGLEDMYLAKQLYIAGHLIGYSAQAHVYHIHDESWSQIKRRYEREAIALREISPEVYLSFWDLVSCIIGSILADSRHALRQRRLNLLPEIIAYRFSQYWGGYRGSHEHRALTRDLKKKYFYPGS